MALQCKPVATLFDRASCLPTPSGKWYFVLEFLFKAMRLGNNPYMKYTPRNLLTSTVHTMGGILVYKHRFCSGLQCISCIYCRYLYACMYECCRSTVGHKIVISLLVTVACYSLLFIVTLVLESTINNLVL